MRLRPALLAALLACAVHGRASAATPPPSAPVLAARLVRAPVVDGVVSEDEWHDAAALTLAYQVLPGDNVPASEPTMVRIGYDRDHLFLAFQARDSAPDQVRGTVRRRDDVYADDYVSIYLDTFNDRRRAYVLYLNPLGVQADGIIAGGTLADASQVPDLTWDGVFTSRGRMTDAGYEVEVAIPFRTLRYANAAEATWGLHVQRWIARKAERVHWQPISRDRAELLPQMGTMTGLKAIAAQRTLDLMPAVTGALVQTPAPLTPAASPGLRQVRDGQFGVSGTYTLTPGLTVSATVNPDFSQVEADVPQIDVNQRFALFYPERRPFFLEGGEIFRTAGVRTFVNTRQIIDPDWGVKLTGKVGAQQVGLLVAADRAPGTQGTPDTPGFGDRALFLVGRLRRDVRENSRIGAFVTQRSFGGGSNTMVAADGDFRVGLTGTIGLQVAASRTTAPTGDRTAGSTSYVWWEHRGRHLRLFTRAYHTSPDYDPQVGFERRTGTYGMGGTHAWEFQAVRPTWWVSVRPFIVTQWISTWQGRTDESYADPGVDIRFARDVKLYTYYSWAQDDFAGRVLPSQGYNARLTIDTFQRLRGKSTVRLGEGPIFDRANPRVGRRLILEEDVELQATRKLSSSLLLLVTRIRDDAGVPVVRQEILRHRTTYQFTRAYGFRSLLDYDTARRQFGASLLASWEPRPNTAVYVGYNDLLTRDPRLRATTVGGRLSRTWFFKVAYGYRWMGGEAARPDPDRLAAEGLDAADLSWTAGTRARH